MTINISRKVVAVFATIALAGGAVWALPANADTPTISKRYITLTAEGIAKSVPDAVRMSATVTFMGATSKEALAKVATSANAVRAALKANKIERKDIASQSVSVYPEYNYTQDKGSILIGYRASQTFTITIRNAASAGDVVDAVVAAGENLIHVNGVSPFVLDATSATNAARANAVAKAKAKAAAYVKLLNLKLGQVNYLIENYSPSNVIPEGIYRKLEAGGGSATVIDLGEQDVSVSITIQWELL